MATASADQSKNLAIAELVIYITLIIPLGLLLFRRVYRNGKPALSGWAYLIVFSILQAVGAALIIAGVDDETSSSSDGSTNGSSTLKIGTIIQAIGASPLLLGTMGIASELNHIAPEPSEFLSSKIVHTVYHILLIAAAILSAIGASKAISSYTAAFGSTNNKAQNEYRGGSILFLVGWIILPFVAIIVKRAVRRLTPLTIVIFLALPILFVRVLYTILTAFLGTDPASDAGATTFNILTGSFGVRLGMDVIMGMLIVVMFILGGFLQEIMGARNGSPAMSDKVGIAA